MENFEPGSQKKHLITHSWIPFSLLGDTTSSGDRMKEMAEDLTEMKKMWDVEKGEYVTRSSTGGLTHWEERWRWRAVLHLYQLSLGEAPAVLHLFTSTTTAPRLFPLPPHSHSLHLLSAFTLHFISPPHLSSILKPALSPSSFFFHSPPHLNSSALLSAVSPSLLLSLSDFQLLGYRFITLQSPSLLLSNLLFFSSFLPCLWSFYPALSLLVSLFPPLEPGNRKH